MMIWPVALALAVAPPIPEPPDEQWTLLSEVGENRWERVRDGADTQWYAAVIDSHNWLVVINTDSNQYLRLEHEATIYSRSVWTGFDHEGDYWTATEFSRTDERGSLSDCLVLMQIDLP